MKGGLIYMAGFGSYQNPEIIQQRTLVTSIPVGQWSGSDGNYYITVTASGITADSIIVPNYDKDSAIALQGPIWCVPGAGSFTINTTKLPTNTVNIMTQFAGTMGVANYQVLADVYSRSQIDNKIANDLSTTVEGKILDARQGKILNDNKANVSDVYSKSQAVAKTDIVNNLTSTSTTAPLSANMGKTLNDNMTVVELPFTTTPSGVVTSVGGVMYQIGKLVIVDLDISMTGNITSDWINIATLPKFPRNSLIINTLPDQVAAGAPLRIRIRSDNGYVQAFYGGSGNYHVHAIYPTT